MTISHPSRSPDRGEPAQPALRAGLRTLLGVALTFAGIGHLTTQRQEFQAQVPSWVPVSEDLVVIASGLVEIGLGLSLVALLIPSLRRFRVPVGLATAAFFVAIFPGNVGQWLEHVDAFGLDTDRERFVRLFFQPVLVAWALWSTASWSTVVEIARAARHR